MYWHLINIDDNAYWHDDAILLYLLSRIGWIDICHSKRRRNFCETIFVREVGLLEEVEGGGEEQKDENEEESRTIKYRIDISFLLFLIPMMYI